MKEEKVGAMGLAIGALMTTKLKKLFYKSDKCLTDSLGCFTSHGPLPNNSIGVDLVAPGGAVVHNPRYYQKRSDLHLGTSYSAPIAAGAIACFLSALKAEGIPYNTFLVKTALINTALLPEDANKLGYGQGITQILSAFEYLRKSKDSVYKNLLNFDLFVGAKEQRLKGIKITSPNVLQNFEVSLEQEVKNPKSKFII